MVGWVFMYTQDPKLLGVFISDVRISGFWASGGWTGGPRLGLDTSLVIDDL